MEPTLGHGRGPELAAKKKCLFSFEPAELRARKTSAPLTVEQSPNLIRYPNISNMFS